MEVKQPDLKWNGTPQKLDSDDTKNSIQHHMAHPSWDIYEVHAFHRDSNGWFGVGYNYFVEFNGDIYEGRGDRVGAHVAGWNDRSYGVGYQGYLHSDSTGHDQQMTDEQVESGAWINAKLLKDNPHLSLDDIIGHNDVSATACPGNNFRMDELRERTQQILDDCPVEEIESQLEKKKVKLEEAEAKLDKKASKIVALEDEIKQLKEDKDQLEEGKDQLEQIIKSQEDELDERDKEISKLKNKIETTKKAHKEDVRDLKKEKDELAEALENDIKALQRQNDELEEEIKKLKAQLGEKVELDLVTALKFVVEAVKQAFSKGRD